MFYTGDILSKFAFRSSINVGL